jgi:hypothetical protein
MKKDYAALRESLLMYFKNTYNGEPFTYHSWRYLINESVELCKLDAHSEQAFKRKLGDQARRAVIEYCEIYNFNKATKVKMTDFKPMSGGRREVDGDLEEEEVENTGDQLSGICLE